MDLESEKIEDQDKYSDPTGTGDPSETSHAAFASEIDADGEKEDFRGPTESEDDVTKLGFDPALWPQMITDQVRTILVTEGPKKPGNEFSYPSYPINESNRRFSPNCMKRKLKNGRRDCPILVNLLRKLGCSFLFLL